MDLLNFTQEVYTSPDSFINENNHVVNGMVYVTVVVRILVRRPAIADRSVQHRSSMSSRSSSLIRK